MLLTESSQKKLEEIRNSGLFCCIEITSDYNFVWDISLRMNIEYEAHSVTHKSGACEDLNDAVELIYDQVKDYINEMA